MHYHQYPYSQKYRVISDHKPLEVILNRPISKSSSRFQRMLLRAQPYDFTITFRPGKEILVADDLSRLYLPEEWYHVHSVILLLQISNSRLEKLKKETTADAQMIVLAKTIQWGWPEARRNLSPTISSFWNVKYNLTITDNIILKGEHLVIPKNSHKEILNRIPVSHLGIEKTKQWARSVVFWPGMTKCIEEHIRHCYACNIYQNSSQKESLIAYEILHLPWEKIGCYIFLQKTENISSLPLAITVVSFKSTDWDAMRTYIKSYTAWRDTWHVTGFTVYSLPKNRRSRINY